MVYGWHYIWTFFAVQFLFGIIIGICGLILNGFVFYQYFELLPAPDNNPKIQLPITSTTDQTDQSESRPGFGLDHSHTVTTNHLDVSHETDDADHDPEHSPHRDHSPQSRRDRFNTLSVPSLSHYGNSSDNHSHSHSRNVSHSQSSKRRFSVFGTKEVRLNMQRAYSVEESPSPKGVQLKYVLQNNELIECFLHHLATEFSVELLLAFIEFKQFHDLMMNDHDFIDDIQELIADNKSALKSSVLDNFAVADDLPQSCIVHNNSEESLENLGNNIQRYLSIVKQLFEKYISHGAEFEINISYLCKQRIIWFTNKFPGDITDEVEMNKMEKFQLFTLYNDAANEMIKLMESSHARCISANKYSSQILD